MKPLDPRLLRDRTALRPFVVFSSIRAVVDTGLLLTQVSLIAAALAGVVEGDWDRARVVRAGTLLVVVTVARALLGWLATVVGRRAARDVSTHVRQRLLGRVLEGASDVAPGQAGVLATRGVDALQPYVAGYVPTLVGAVVAPALLLVAVFVTDPTSGVLLLVTLPLVPVFMVLVGRFSADRAAASWASVERLSAHLHDVIAGLPTLKRFNRHRMQTETVARMGDESRRATMVGLRTAFLSALVLELAATLSVALVAVSVGLRLVSGHIALAPAFLVLLLTPEVFAPLRRIGTEYHTATEGMAAAAEILDVIDRPAPVPGGTTPVPEQLSVRCRAIRVEHAGRPGGRPDGVDLDAGTGEIVALVGPNGGGKTTVLDVVRGAVRPDRGTVTVDGVDVADLDAEAWRRRIAWVPQRPVLVDDTVRANILLGAPATGAAAVEAAATEVGLAGLLDRPARSLSAGEQQRVALARAVVRVDAGPAGGLLLLDEPSANLDDATESLVVAVVQRLAALGATVIVVAHRAALVGIADRVVMVTASSSGSTLGDGIEGVAPPRRDAVPAGRAAEPAAEATAADAPVLASGRRARRWLADESRPVRLRLLATIGLGAAATGAGLALTACAAWLLSRASQHPAVLSLGVMVVVIRALALSKAGLRYLERLASHDTVLRMVADLRVRVFDRLAVLVPAGVPGDRRGDLLSRVVGDLDAVQDLWLRGLLPPAVALTVGAMVMVAVLIMLPAAAVVLGAALAFGGLAVPWLATRVQRDAGDRAAVERIAQVTDIVDLTEAAGELAAYGAGRDRLASVARRDQRIGVLARSDATFTGLTDALESALGAVTAAALLVVVAVATRGGHLDPLLVGSVVLLGWMLPEIVGGLPAAARRLQDLTPTAARVTGLLDRPEVVADPGDPVAPPAGPVDVAIDGLVVRWPGQAQPVLTGADLHLPAGSVTVLLGPSGAGKSTLAAALVRFVDPERGTIRVGGVDLAAMRGDDVRRVVGWCAQDTHLFDASIRDNLRIARPEATDDELRAVLARVGLDRWLAGLTRGLDTGVGLSGRAVSGGEARRLALAQVLLADPPVVVLDEPTANLDPTSAERIMGDLVAAAHGRTVLVITHRTEGIEAADQIVRLDHGRIAAGSTDRSPALADAR